MKVLVCYSTSLPKLAPMAAAFGKSLEGKGHKVELVQVTPNSKPMSMMAYDLVVFGSQSLGFFGGRIPDDMASFIAKCSRLEGRKTAAFLAASGFGTGKSLSVLMKAIEKQGGVITDFATLGSEKDAANFGAKFKD